eukprot:TRINITY_DN23751_c0_g1_i1.p1 TRINITY_DN23751_c0_g1~~TRINITY_DN23751_c0_g1_i1.p1  ORF type:complete len:315 (+),score=64.35 TRINITY_DN23751_c0_g1_i1:2-946(+)
MCMHKLHTLDRIHAMQTITSCSWLKPIPLFSSSSETSTRSHSQRRRLVPAAFPLNGNNGAHCPQAPEHLKLEASNRDGGAELLQSHSVPHAPSTPPALFPPSPSEAGSEEHGRRELVAALALAISVPFLPSGEGRADSLPVEEKKREFTDMPALRGKDYGKTKMKYPDYVETESGLQYKDLRDGNGPGAQKGDMVVIDWDGFTIGYYGRIFEARNKAKGGSFTGNEKDYYRFRLGIDKVIPAFEEAIQGMQVGGVRRIIVPPELGYPDNDYRKAGPSPLTFSGQRTLAFVLENAGLIDKTLLFDIELLRIVPGN